jgi:hypothetical protein
MHLLANTLAFFDQSGNLLHHHRNVVVALQHEGQNFFFRKRRQENVAGIHLTSPHLTSSWTFPQEITGTVPSTGTISTGYSVVVTGQSPLLHTRLGATSQTNQTRHCHRRYQKLYSRSRSGKQANKQASKPRTTEEERPGTTGLVWRGGGGHLQVTQTESGKQATVAQLNVAVAVRVLAWSRTLPYHLPHLSSMSGGGMVTRKWETRNKWS